MIPRNQAIIDAYALPSGLSYKRVSRVFHRGEHAVRAMIERYAPEIMRTRSEQAMLSGLFGPALKPFCLADLGLVACGPCKSCKIELVGKTDELRTCGLCLAYARRAA